MSKLSEKIRRSLEFRRTVKGWDLVLQRPREAELRRMLREYPDTEQCEFEMAYRYTVGWHNVTEDKVLKGGKSDLIQFDKDAWLEMLQDDNELWQMVVVELFNEYQKHQEKREEQEKN